ncbi:hypothetical protein DCAR_0207332 [Daucus carota subsp. sativus]|uniref:Uncharacterized protein n=1 Tax=Daucus carota subsp. sativus TaxID=79200 RepID=A0AAF0WGT9_DAUCS|nr:hypothetical protein DCAR_0207332 [Daucus carota subsp. sativus]
MSINYYISVSNSSSSLHVAMKTKIRKILSVVEVLDYRDPGPNPGHDPGGPGKGKPGGKGINP